MGGRRAQRPLAQRPVSHAAGQAWRPGRGGRGRGAWRAPRGTGTPALADDPPTQARILSPFDSLVISRGSSCCGRSSTLSSATAQAKRKYGYFCLPVLWRHRFVARIDLKADRKAGVLRVQGLWLEPDAGESSDGELWPALAAALHEFAAFNGCSEIDAGEWKRLGA